MKTLATSKAAVLRHLVHVAHRDLDEVKELMDVRPRELTYATSISRAAPATRKDTEEYLEKTVGLPHNVVVEVLRA
jgi:hypothetical protein